MFQRNSWYYCIYTTKYLADASVKPAIVTECIIVSVAYPSDWSVQFEDAEMLDMDEKEKVCVKHTSLLCKRLSCAPCSTAAELSTPNPKIKCSNPTIGTITL
jgi:hypothetical protein